tara:strand:- start:509 stop:844 length:336 start_codon:yes stop_codon:yes gene_type:complete
MIEIILALSIVVNLFLVWYGHLLIRKVLFVSSNTSEVLVAIDRFKEHITGVYELETFYGDETLKALLDHTGDLSTFLTECENAYGLTESEYENYVQSNEEEETPQDEQGRR